MWKDKNKWSRALLRALPPTPAWFSLFQWHHMSVTTSPHPPRWIPSINGQLMPWRHPGYWIKNLRFLLAFPVWFPSQSMSVFPISADLPACLSDRLTDLLTKLLGDLLTYLVTRKWLVVNIVLNNTPSTLIYSKLHRHKYIFLKNELTL